jgi:hypothetical protein
MLKRLHLFELEDQTWFPKNIRNYMTDYLQILANTLKLYDGILPILKKGVDASGTRQIVDLASGGGGGWLAIAETISKEIPDIHILLTDYYPNISAFEQIKIKNPKLFSYATQSIDATHVPKSMQGLRTQFLSFHHFTPEMCASILQNAVDDRQPIAIFEFLERDLIHLLKIGAIPASVYALTPFIKPFSLERLFYTYTLPIVPLSISFDGLVSVFRTYTLDEMREMTQMLLGGDTYQWEIGVQKNALVSTQYLLGIPKN